VAKNRICQLLDIQYPVFQGGMAWVADGRLAAAVSNGGGLGIIGAGQAPVEVLQKEIALAKELTDKPFGINIMMQSPFVAQVAQLAAESGVNVVVTGAGNPAPYIEMWKKAGMKVIPVIPSVKIALKMEALGVDAVVAEGMESGGHIGETTTMSLVPQVADAVKIPVVAAGGIADGRGMAAAFLLGAEGIQMGTAFLVAHECKISADFKARILAAGDSDTVVTGRRAKHAVRSLKNEFTEQYLELEQEAAPIEEMENLATGSLRRAVEGNDMRMGSLCAGQIAGLVKTEASAAEVIFNVVTQAEELLNRHNFALRNE